MTDPDYTTLGGIVAAVLGTGGIGGLALDALTEVEPDRG